MLGQQQNSQVDAVNFMILKFVLTSISGSCRIIAAIDISELMNSLLAYESLFEKTLRVPLRVCTVLCKAKCTDC